MDSATTEKTYTDNEIKMAVFAIGRNLGRQAWYNMTHDQALAYCKELAAKRNFTGDLQEKIASYAMRQVIGG